MPHWAAIATAYVMFFMKIVLRAPLTVVRTCLGKKASGTAAVRFEIYNTASLVQYLRVNRIVTAVIVLVAHGVVVMAFVIPISKI